MQYKCYVNTFKKQYKCLCKMLGVRQIRVLLSGTFWNFFLMFWIWSWLNSWLQKQWYGGPTVCMFDREMAWPAWPAALLSCLLAGWRPSCVPAPFSTAFLFLTFNLFFLFFFILFGCWQVGQPFNYLLLFVLSLLFAILVCFSFLSVRFHRFNLHLFQWI